MIPSLTLHTKPSVLRNQTDNSVLRQCPRFSAESNGISMYEAHDLASFRDVKEPVYLERLSRLKSTQLKQKILKANIQIKRAYGGYHECEFMPEMFFVSGPAWIYARIARSRAEHHIKGIASETMRLAMIQRMIDCGVAGVQKIGYGAVATLSPGKERDSLIEKACKEEKGSVRKVGASLLHLVSDPELKKSLIKVLVLDPNGGARRRANLAKNPQGLVNKLFGWYFFKGSTALSNQTAFVDDDEDFSVGAAAPLGQAAPNSPNAKIDALGQQMADRLKTHFKEDPIVRQALIDKYGDESHLPSAVDIKKQFYQAAKKHLTGKTGFLGRLFGEGTSPEQITALTFTLMNIADKTEAFLNMGEITKQLSLLGELEEQQKKMTVDLEKAKAVLAQQALFRARATKEHETQQKKIAELEAAQKQAGTSESEVLKSERQLLKDTEDRKKIFDAAFQLAQSKVDTLNSHIETSQKKAIMAMQYGMLGISREELQGLLDKNEINLELLHTKGLLDRATDKKYEVLAEQDRTQQEGAVRAFLVEEPTTAPKTLEAKH